MNRWLGLVLTAVVTMAVGAGVGSAGMRNAWFSSGEMVPGQIIRSEGELPAETKVFDSAVHKVARLYMVFGDVDPHEMRGELKDPDGKTVRTMKYDIGSLTRAGVSWRHASFRFNLQGLVPAVYTLEMTVDGGKPQKHSFTLK